APPQWRPRWRRREQVARGAHLTDHPADRDPWDRPSRCAVFRFRAARARTGGAPSNQRELRTTANNQLAIRRLVAGGSRTAVDSGARVLWPDATQAARWLRAAARSPLALFRF